MGITGGEGGEHDDDELCGTEAVLCVVNHPEQFKDERVGYSVVVLTGGHAVLKDIVRGYEVLVLSLQHAGVAVEQGWQPASSHEMKDLGQRVQQASFSFYRLTH